MENTFNKLEKFPDKNPAQKAMGKWYGQYHFKNVEELVDAWYDSDSQLWKKEVVDVIDTLDDWSLEDLETFSNIVIDGKILTDHNYTAQQKADMQFELFLKYNNKAYFERERRKQESEKQNDQLEKKESLGTPLSSLTPEKQKEYVEQKVKFDWSQGGMTIIKEGILKEVSLNEWDELNAHIEVTEMKYSDTTDKLEPIPVMYMIEIDKVFLPTTE